MGRGFIAWAASDDPAAAELRKIATIHFIPIMDIDNVAIGAGGKDAIPRDHNRDWSDEPAYPEVAAAQAKIQVIDRARRFERATRARRFRDGLRADETRIER